MKPKSAQISKLLMDRIKNVRRPVIISIIFLLLGIMLLLIYFLLLPKIIKSQVMSNMQLKEGSIIFDKWKEVPIDVFFKVYLFDVTNPSAVVDGARPIVREKGPYVFIQRQKKDIIGYFNEGEVIRYNEISSYIFQPKLSNGSLNDVITIPNVPLITFVSTIDGKLSKIPLHQLASPVIFSFLSSLLNLNKEHVFTRQTIRSILFDGYSVPFMHTLKMIFFPIHLLFGFQFPKTGLSPDNRFALLLGKNNTPTGPYEVYTGLGPNVPTGDASFRSAGHWSSGQESHFTKIKSFQGSQMLNYWHPKSSHCNLIKGTDGHQFGPFVDKSKPLFIFNPDVCRSFPMTYLSDGHVKGFKTYQFVMSKDTFASEKTKSDNYCYCKRGDYCPDGVLDVSSCRFNAPIWLSNPHLFQAGDRVKRSSVDGLKPSKDKHMSYLHVEPMTGTVLKANIKIAVNVLVKKYRIFKDMKNLQKESLIPVMWVETAAEIDEANAAELADQLTKPITIANSSLISLIVTSFFAALIALIYLCCHRDKEHKPESAKPKKQFEKNISVATQSDSFRSKSRNSMSRMSVWSTRSASVVPNGQPTAPYEEVDDHQVYPVQSQDGHQKSDRRESISIQEKYSRNIYEKRRKSSIVPVCPMINESEVDGKLNWNNDQLYENSRRDDHRPVYSPVFVAAIFGRRRPSYPRELVEELASSISTGVTRNGNSFFVAEGGRGGGGGGGRASRRSIPSPSLYSSPSSSYPSSQHLRHLKQSQIEDPSPAKESPSSRFSLFPTSRASFSSSSRPPSTFFSSCSSSLSQSRSLSLSSPSFSHFDRNINGIFSLNDPSFPSRISQQNGNHYGGYHVPNNANLMARKRGAEKEEDEIDGEQKKSFWSFLPFQQFRQKEESSSPSVVPCNNDPGHKPLQEQGFVREHSSPKNSSRKVKTYDYISDVVPVRTAPSPPTSNGSCHSQSAFDTLDSNQNNISGHLKQEERSSSGHGSRERFQDAEEEDDEEDVSTIPGSTCGHFDDQKTEPNRSESREINDENDEIFTISQHLFGHRSKEVQIAGNGSIKSKKEILNGHPLKRMFKKSEPVYGQKM